MTSFGRAEGTFGDQSWVWELKSVNNKGLDVRLRLPPGFDRLERQVRALVGKSVSRGSFQIFLALEKAEPSASVRLNAEALKVVLDTVRTIDQQANTRPSSAAEILALRGVMESQEAELSDDEQTKLFEAIIGSFFQALRDLIENRQQEGKALAEVLSGQLDQIEQHTLQVETDPSRSADAIRSRLEQQVQSLLSVSGLDQDRLAAEAALLATKADIREELDRLTAHIQSARDHLANDGPVGRKLEFLAQEINREANTLCSKSNAVSVTNQGLAIKVLIDQFREQVLNVE